MRRTTGLPAVCLPLFASLIITKAVACGWWNWREPWFPVKLGLLVFQDLLFVLGWGMLGAAALAATRGKPRLQHCVWGAWLGASSLCVVYGVASIWVYQAFRMFMTYPLLLMAGAVSDVSSSLAGYVSPAFILSLLAAPVLYLLAVWRLLRWRWLGEPRSVLTLTLVAVLAASLGAYGYQRFLAGGRDHALAQNPQWVLLASYLERWQDGRPPGLQETGSPSYREDFQTVGGRAIAGAGGAAGHSLTTRPSTAIRNVIVVVLESTGTQFLSVYDRSYNTTPCLAAEAGNCLVWRNFYSNAGYTLQSMLPLVLSIYPGTEWTIYASICPHLPGKSMAGVLHDAGRRTAFMTSQRLNYQDIRRFYENRDFDLVEGCEEFQLRGIGTPLSSWGMDDAPLFDQMLKWIDQQPGKPFYLMAWTQQSHHPYPLAPGQRPLELAGAAGRGGEKRHELNEYLNAIHLADEQLGRLFAALRQRGLADSTLVVVTGDHGEGFGFPHPWCFHGTALYQESVNVPLVFWNPRLFHPGSRSDVVGAHVDLNATILDLLRISPPASWQGRSLFDPARPQRCYFACNTGNLLLGMREADQKFIYNVTQAREELYDLASDPTEETNLAAQQPARCEIYRQRLAAWAGFQGQHLKALVAAAK